MQHEDQIRDAGRGHLLPGSALPVESNEAEVRYGTFQAFMNREQELACDCGCVGDHDNCPVD